MASVGVAASATGWAGVVGAAGLLAVDSGKATGEPLEGAMAELAEVLAGMTRTSLVCLGADGALPLIWPSMGASGNVAPVAALTSGVTLACLSVRLSDDTPIGRIGASATGMPTMTGTVETCPTLPSRPSLGAARTAGRGSTGANATRGDASGAKLGKAVAIASLPSDAIVDAVAS